MNACATPSITGHELALFAIPEAKKYMPPCALADTPTAAPCAAWPTAGYKFSSPCCETEPSMTCKEEPLDPGPISPLTGGRVHTAQLTNGGESSPSPAFGSRVCT